MKLLRFAAAVSFWLSLATADKEAALARLDAPENDDGYNQELLDLVAIPSVSSLPENQPDILRAAAWLEARLKKAGMENVQVLHTQGPRPVVYAECLHAPPGAPTALVYAHYDVQPAADTADLWTSPPFEPEIRGGRAWGRGVDDDKGSGVLPPIQALEALLASGGSVPINVKVMLEGEEEVGSPFLEPFLAKHAGLLAADFVLSADGGQIAADQPAALLGLRGALAVEVQVATATTDVHSGMAGGAVQNPARSLAQLLSTMWHPNNSIAVAGWYDNVREISEGDREDMAAYGFDEQRELLGPLGASAAVGEEGYTSLERLWHRPTLEVVGIGGGF
ncbi:Cytosolic non-specific dipeptidase [Chlorella vulgaris]